MVPRNTINTAVGSAECVQLHFQAILTVENVCCAVARALKWTLLGLKECRPFFWGGRDLPSHFQVRSSLSP